MLYTAVGFLLVVSPTNATKARCLHPGCLNPKCPGDCQVEKRIISTECDCHEDSKLEVTVTDMEAAGMDIHLEHPQGQCCSIPTIKIPVQPPAESFPYGKPYDNVWEIFKPNTKYGKGLNFHVTRGMFNPKTFFAFTKKIKKVRWLFDCGMNVIREDVRVWTRELRSIQDFGGKGVWGNLTIKAVACTYEDCGRKKHSHIWLKCEDTSKDTAQDYYFAIDYAAIATRIYPFRGNYKLSEQKDDDGEDFTVAKLDWRDVEPRKLEKCELGHGEECSCCVTEMRPFLKKFLRKFKQKDYLAVDSVISIRGHWNCQTFCQYWEEYFGVYNPKKFCNYWKRYRSIPGFMTETGHSDDERNLDAWKNITQDPQLISLGQAQEAFCSWRGEHDPTGEKEIYPNPTQLIEYAAQHDFKTSRDDCVKVLPQETDAKAGNGTRRRLLRDLAELAA